MVCDSGEATGQSGKFIRPGVNFGAGKVSSHNICHATLMSLVA